MSRDEVIFLLEQFRVSPSERTNAYCRRLVDTFVDKVELTNRELIIHFNISKSTENKNSQSNNRCSTGKRLVGDERIELPQVESESTALPLCKSPLFGFALSTEAPLTKNIIQPPPPFVNHFF